MTSNNNQTTVVFRIHTMPDATASQKAGRPIFSDMEVCDIAFAGNTKTRATFPAHEAEPNATRESVKDGNGVVTYAMLYNEQYRAFKAGVSQPTSGTPLSEAPFLAEAKRRELKALNIHTVEALAGLDGNPLKQLGMGGRDLKNQAQAYLDNAAGSADVTALAAQNASLLEQMADLREQIAQMSGRNTPVKEVGATADPNVYATHDEPETEARPDASTDFDKWDDDKLKDYIAEHNGSRPRGNPSHNTLVAAAVELANG
ncbi:hypothetical protein IG197_01850 [Aminobacter sp. SR38]|jgi:hypothetical protein|uniref:hypothetical protein n=1 Tax=Aminobacter sp. SR38 TaxID=2774562 RepID=UPI001783B9E8|nr:hypothetical protein [Aminobacter sp. SR38]QOF71861.1 hypothetical protein IG197_01850 [Aminobacter sp. SR38]